MRIEAISIGLDPPREVNVIIEVPVGGEPIKYEMDKDAGTLVVDRFLYTAMRYPGNYGFIPHTLSGDGDPCDVLVANTRAIVPGAVMSVRPVGVLLMEDEAGGDEKIIAVPSSKLTQRYDKVKTYSDLPEITLQQIQHFFEHYKDLEPGKWVKVLRWGGAEDAHQLILEGIARAKGKLKRRAPTPSTGGHSGMPRARPGTHTPCRDLDSGLLALTPSGAFRSSRRPTKSTLTPGLGNP
jgi:inorganic pyrophosphatase